MLPEMLQLPPSNSERNPASAPSGEVATGNGTSAARDVREPITAGSTMRDGGSDSATRQPDGNPSRDLSRAMVNLLKDYNGRGPSHARAYVNEDLVTVVLRRTMTKAEQTLADEGEEALVREMRQGLHRKFRDDATGIVERLTGQHVSSFLSDHDVDKDIVVQTFVLEPRPT
jgi:uncharacterized protein YbcI